MDGDLAYFDGLKTTPLDLPGRKDASIHAVSAENNGWILGATEAGLVIIKAGVHRVLDTIHGLPCNSVLGAITDDRHNLWVTTQCGLVEMSEADIETWWREPTFVVKSRVFGPFDGYQAGWASFRTITRTADGRIWFTNGTSLQMIDPAHMQLNPDPPPVHIETLTADGKHVDVHGFQLLPPKTREIALDFTALSFVSPRSVMFRYKLDGQDSSWQQAGSRRSAFYTNLRPGTYTFHVVACNNSGVWNLSGDSFTFRIEPAAYQTRWFLYLCISLTLFLLWGLYQMRIRAAMKQVTNELSARMEERERVARDLHDTILQGFQGLILRFQSVLNSMPEGAGRESMEKALQRADDVMVEARQSVKELRAQDVKDEFQKRISVCCEELAEVFATPFEVSVLGNTLPVVPVVAQEVYKITREALFNAFQHSHASLIQVELTYQPDQLVVTVRDDGVGFSEALLKVGRLDHWGIAGMRERAKKIAGQFNISTRGGVGTEVTLLLPAAVAYVKQVRMSMVRAAFSRLAIPGMRHSGSAGSQD